MILTLKRKLVTFTTLPGATLWLFAKAVFISAAVRFTLLFLPFKHLLKRLGTVHKESTHQLSDAEVTISQRLKVAMSLCKRYVPWDSTCYVQAITAKILLNRKNIPATIYIGFKKNENNEIIGHAWLRCGNKIITGNQGLATYHVHSYFSS